MKKASGPQILCPRCGKRARGVYAKKDMKFTCSKCRQTLLFTDRCRRELLFWQILYHVVTFSVILGIFWLLSRQNQTMAVIAAMALITVAGGMGKPLTYYWFYQKDKFRLKDEV